MMPNTSPAGAAVAAPPFDEDIAVTLRRLKSALAGVFAELPGPIKGGADVQRLLKIPSTLSWQLHGIVSSTNPMAAATQIPGRQAAAKALAAAAAHGVPDSSVARAAQAFEDFESCVNRHAGDRAAFASMVSSIAPAEASIDLDARRDAFRAMSHIYGVQIDVSLHCFMVRPGPSPGQLDTIIINGSVGLRAMRAFQRLFIARHGYTRDYSTDSTQDAPDGRPITVPDGAETAQRDEDLLLAEFSTRELPRIKSERPPSGCRELYISGPPVGRTGELTFFLAERFTPPVDDEPMGFGMTQLYPARTQIHDVLVAPSLFERASAPATGLFGGALHELRRQCRETDRLNTPAQSAFVGEGVESLQTPSVPRYVQMLSYVCERLGWARSDFDAYRCQVEYPVLHSFLNVEFPPIPHGRPGEK